MKDWHWISEIRSRIRNESLRIELLHSTPAAYSSRVLSGKPRRFEQHIDTPVACGLRVADGY